MGGGDQSKQVTFEGEALVLKKHPRILMERCLDFGARVRNKALFIAKYESPTFKVTTPLPHVLHN